MPIGSSARVDLLFTDVVLPGMSGRILVDRALGLRPGLKVLFTTGYSRDAIVHQGRLDAGVQLIRETLVCQSICEFGTGCQTAKAPVAPLGVISTAIEGVVQLIDDMKKQ